MPTTVPEGSRPVIPTPFDDDPFDDGTSAPVETPVKEINVRTGEVLDGSEKPAPTFVHAFVCTKRGCKGLRPESDYDPEKDTLCPFCGSPMTRHHWTTGGRRMRFLAETAA